ncbi:thiol peroxidase [Corynebacterium pelargi]|uniref:Thiol peroxidase n=1 Tax=Corynebacterium pelargi TaxID=1471400 RepID=A0A410W8I9_9CORY|nr:thiol peroxidase [Corynebacterium pelargi]QAU52275.1 putative thiol peroxidase [Corynebacterium pelargi]GGG68873.1 putative thiol peroxidase [Corynebacterium pelargi]
MALTHFQGNEANTNGNLPEAGSTLPEFTLVGTDLKELGNKDFAGKRLVLNIFPSIDTGVCAASVREFNQRAAALDNTVVLCVSEDLPFALARFCGAEGIDNVVSASGFRTSFAQDFGVQLQDSPLEGLMARAVVVADENGAVLHAQLVEEIGTEPDYDAAVDALA